LSRLGDAAAHALGRVVAEAVEVAGGDLNDAWRLDLEDGDRAFVKTSPDALAGGYETEAAGLRWLAEPGALRVPAVLAVGAGDPPLLALEWIDTGRPGPDHAEQLGRGLAAMHAAGADAFGSAPPGAPGGDAAPLRLGPLEIPNEPANDWATFYADSRLRPLADRAEDRGALPDGGRDTIERLCERMPDLAGPAEPPARLHGDLWSGNVMTDAGGAPVLVDPAAYGGHREVDLAMLDLFGSPGERFTAAYEEARPLAEGHADRTALWQVFPLLVHAALFGGGYGDRAVRAARRYVG
jgi:fructosamine-3-kinase